MLASDYNAIFSLETLSLQNQPVDRVEVGESFKLQLSLEYLNSSLASTYFNGGFVGISFDASLAEKAGDFVFAEAYPFHQHYQIKSPGEWEDIGAIPNQYLSYWENPPSRHIIWEVEMKAIAGGEVVFESNPSDVAGVLRGILPGYSNVVEFGYARLQIGDPVVYPSSPWRSPGDPSDVDGNGEVTEDDLYLLEMILGRREPEVPYQSTEPRGRVDLPPDPLTDEIRALMELGAQGSIQLVGSQVPIERAPYLDVNGDRIADIKDIRAVEEEFQTLPRSSQDETPPEFIRNPDFQIGVQWRNLRTQAVLTQGAQVRVGDLIKIEWTDADSKYLQSFYKWMADSRYRFVEGREDLVQIVQPGNLTFALKPELDPFGRMASVIGVTQEALLARLNELATPATRRAVAQANNNRPDAVDRSFPYTQFVGLDSAREAVALLSKPKGLDISIDTKNGLLMGNNSPASLRVMPVVNPNRGALALKEDGSFTYSVYDIPYSNSMYESLKAGDEFQYVIISPEGVSEIHRVNIEPVTIPLLDLHLRAVDASGNPIQSAVVGEEFYIEVMTFGNDNYRRMPRQLRPVHSLQVDYGYDTQIAQPVGDPETSEIFNWERAYLVVENGRMVVKTEIMRPEFESMDGEIRTSFQRFSLMLPETRLFRQKVIATQPGSLQLELNDPVLVLEIKDTASFRMQVDDLVVLSAVAASVGFRDVSGDGIVSPFDSLLVINYLNASPTAKGAGESLAAGEENKFDVNRDGITSPLDALIIINWLNLHASSGHSAYSGEGESVAPASDLIGFEVDTVSFDETFHRRKSRGR